MKWILTLSLFIIFFVYDLSAQPLVDAIEFKSVISSAISEVDKKDNLYKILYKYAPKEFQDSPESVLQYFGERDNLYIKDLVHPVIAGGSTSIVSSTPDRAFTSSGSLDFTNIAFGVTDFLIERAKNELNTAFFKRLDVALEDGYIKSLFPKTKKVLEVIGAEIYQYNHYLNTLRTAFADDLKALLDHLPAVIDLLADKGVIVINSDEYHILHVIAEIGGRVQQKLHPGEILLRTAESSHMIALGETSRKPEYKGLFNIVECAALFSESFRNTGSDQYWVGDAEFVQLKDETTLRIYLGLVYEISKTAPYNNIKFSISGKDKTLKDILEDIDKDWNQDNTLRIWEFLQQFKNETRDAAHAIEYLQKLQGELGKNADLSNREKRARLFEASLDVYNSFVNLLKLAYNIDKLPFADADSAKVLPGTKDLVELLELGGDIGTQLLNGQYAGAVTNVAIILKGRVNKQDFVSDFLKYGTFMANVVEADSPEETKSAIEAIALPPGSYTAKRESACNIALNGYIGAFYGQERMDGVEDKGFNNLAITAPIGVSISLGNVLKDCKNPWSFSLFAPIIDLGTIASYRLKTSSMLENEPETLPTINLKHIIAPGLFAEIGIGGTPLSFGVGGQFGPRLRNVDTSANPSAEIGETYFRLGLSLKVDIPLLNLYNKPVK